MSTNPAKLQRLNGSTEDTSLPGFQFKSLYSSSGNSKQIRSRMFKKNILMTALGSLTLCKLHHKFQLALICSSHLVWQIRHCIDVYCIFISYVVALYACKASRNCTVLVLVPMTIKHFWRLKCEVGNLSTNILYTHFLTRLFSLCCCLRFVEAADTSLTKYLVI